MVAGGAGALRKSTEVRNTSPTPVPLLSALGSPTPSSFCVPWDLGSSVSRARIGPGPVPEAAHFILTTKR